MKIEYGIVRDLRSTTFNTVTVYNIIRSVLVQLLAQNDQKDHFFRITRGFLWGDTFATLVGISVLLVYR